MKALIVEQPAPIETTPLKLVDLEKPKPADDELLVRVRTCGVCRTDLHVCEGDLPPHNPRIVPGHEVVGVVEARGSSCEKFAVGERVGIAWLRETCGRCVYCLRGSENLCPNAIFTGYDRDGGYAEFAVIKERFAYALPESLADDEAAPLLCAGIIGFRALKRANVKPNTNLGIYGFGGSAHICIQVAKYWGCRVFVMSRGGRHRQLARSMGADWIGDSYERPPPPLDSAILFAPAGELVLPAMEALDRGGILAIAGIHLSDIPPLNYQRHLFYEREIRSVTANTLEDGREFLKLAGEIPIRTRTTTFALDAANSALQMLKHDEIAGAAVLRVS
jgi:propanol-preferring alcohol dehydrogenase